MGVCVQSGYKSASKTATDTVFCSFDPLTFERERKLLFLEPAMRIYVCVTLLLAAAAAVLATTKEDFASHEGMQKCVCY